MKSVIANRYSQIQLFIILIYYIRPWPLCSDSSKTSTAILLKFGKCVAFGKKACDQLTRIRQRDRHEYIFLQNFKMKLYNHNDEVNDHIKLRDEMTGAEVDAVTAISECLKEVKKGVIQFIFSFDDNKSNQF